MRKNTHGPAVDILHQLARERARGRSGRCDTAMVEHEGAKMSKTKGNVLDPTEISKDYGADSLRFALVTQGSPGVDMRLSMQVVEAMSLGRGDVFDSQCPARGVLGQLRRRLERLALAHVRHVQHRLGRERLELAHRLRGVVGRRHRARGAPRLERLDPSRQGPGGGERRPFELEPRRLWELRTKLVGLGLSQVLADLDAEANALFTGRRVASKPFYQALDRHSDARKRLREAAVSGDDWRQTKAEADAVVLTSDNPRDEAPQAILAQIAAGLAAAVGLEDGGADLHGHEGEDRRPRPD